MNWYSPNELLKQYEVFAALMWLSFGFALREQSTTTAYDWSLLSGQRRLHWIHAVYFITKVSYWITMCLILLGIYSIHRIDCKGVAYGVKVSLAFLTIGSTALLACRVAVVYDRRRARSIAVAILTGLGFGVAAAWFYQISKIDAFWVKGSGKPWMDGACVFAPVPATDVTGPVVTVAFDLLVLIIVIYGIYNLEAEHTPVGRRLLVHNVMYVAMIFIFTALNLGFQISNLNPIMTAMLIGPSTTASMVLSTRLHVELAASIRATSETSAAASGCRPIGRSTDGPGRAVKDLRRDAGGPSSGSGSDLGSRWTATATATVASGLSSLDNRGPTQHQRRPEHSRQSEPQRHTRSTGGRWRASDREVPCRSVGATPSHGALTPFRLHLDSDSDIAAPPGPVDDGRANRRPYHDANSVALAANSRLQLQPPVFGPTTAAHGRLRLSQAVLRPSDFAPSSITAPRLGGSADG
ncbi:hypothetical protein V8E36_006044 [Tilletia maclaganii]